MGTITIDFHVKENKGLFQDPFPKNEFKFNTSENMMEYE